MVTTTKPDFRLSGSQQKIEPKLKMWIEVDEVSVFGDGRLLLLRAIAETGSIKQAALKLNMSYRAAWGKIKASEERLGITLVEKHHGSLGGAELTKEAQEFINCYLKFQEEAFQAVQKSFEQNLSHFWK